MLFISNFKVIATIIESSREIYLASLVFPFNCAVSSYSLLFLHNTSLPKWLLSNNKVFLLVLVSSWIVSGCEVHTPGVEVLSVPEVVAVPLESPLDGRPRFQGCLLQRQVRCPPRKRSVVSAAPSDVSTRVHEVQP